MKFTAAIKVDHLSVRSNEIFAEGVSTVDFKECTALIDKFITVENEDILIDFDTETGTATLREAE